MTDSHADRVAADVRAEMARRRRTQTDLAAHLKLSQAAVSRRLLGDVEFTVSELAAVAEFLDVETAIFLPSERAS